MKAYLKVNRLVVAIFVPVLFYFSCLSYGFFLPYVLPRLSEIKITESEESTFIGISIIASLILSLFGIVLIFVCRKKNKEFKNKTDIIVIWTPTIVIFIFLLFSFLYELFTKGFGDFGDVKQLWAFVLFIVLLILFFGFGFKGLCDGVYWVFTKVTIRRTIVKELSLIKKENYNNFSNTEMIESNFINIVIERVEEELFNKGFLPNKCILNKDIWRRKVVDSVSNQEQLKLITIQESQEISEKVFKRIEKKNLTQDFFKDMVLNAKDRNIGKEAEKKLTNQNQLSEVAKYSKYSESRKAAAEKLTAQNLLIDIAKTSEYSDVRMMVAARLTDQTIAQEVYADVAKKDDNIAEKTAAIRNFDTKNMQLIPEIVDQILSKRSYLDRDVKDFVQFAYNASQQQEQKAIILKLVLKYKICQ